MYISHNFRNATDGYMMMLGEVLKHGKPVAPRGMPTLEISSAVTLTKPLEMVPFVHGRHNNYFGMLAEALWPLSEIDDLKLMQNWNRGLGEYSDDGETLFGAYGPRINGHNQLGYAIERLKKDNDSRQAVIAILDPTDQSHTTKDFPCNNEVMFKIREGRLNMTVINRSNDIHWGLFGVNTAQFAMLMNYVAGQVGVPVGEQTHISDSLHVYLEPHPNAKLTEAIRKPFQINSEITEILMFYKHYSTPVSIIPLWGGSLGTKYEHLLRHTLEYIPGSMAYPISAENSFLKAIFILLSTYVQFRKLKPISMNLTATINEMYVRLFDLADKDFDYLPLDWIFACTATLAWYNTEATVDVVMDNWERLLNKHAVHLTSEARKDLVNFIVRG